MPKVMETLAENIIRHRKLNQLTQAQLAERMGTSRQTIVRYEHGEGGLDAKTIADFARVFAIEETELLTPVLPPQSVTIRKAEFDALQELLANMKTHQPDMPIPRDILEGLSNLDPKQQESAWITIRAMIVGLSKSQKKKANTG